jgi:hypothetical protein
MRTVTTLAIGIAAAALVLVTAAPRAIGAPNDAGTDAVDAATEGGIPACVKVSTDARYVPGGYNHIVILANGCAKAAACTVSTDVNPQVQAISVPAGATTEVLTFMASPAYTFVARVSCTLR